MVKTIEERRIYSRTPAVLKQTKEYRSRPTSKAQSYARSTAWRKKNPEAIKKIMAKHDAKRKSGGTDPKLMAARRDWYLKNRYGITEADYQKILLSQGGVCALCGKRPGRARLAVDHDHTIQRATGVIVIRGLLHNRCNRNLGSTEHSEESIRRAIQYLQGILDKRSEHIILIDVTSKQEKEKSDV